MNRRSFVLGLGFGLAACAAPPRKRSARKRTTPPDPRASASNLGAPTLAFVGDALVSFGATTTAILDATTLAPRSTQPRTGSIACVSADAIVETSAACAITRTPLGGTAQPVSIAPCSAPSRIVAAADRLWLVGDRDIAQIDAGHIVATHAFTAPTQAFALDDRLVVLGAEDLAVLGGAEPLVHTGFGTAAHHLVRASGERVWFTRALDEDAAWAWNELALANLAAPTQVITPFDLRPGRIVHLHAFGDGVLVLVHTRLTRALRWEVAVLTEAGKVRWHATVPDEFATLDLNVHGCVALSATRAVLTRGEHQLLAWDAETGIAIS